MFLNVRLHKPTLPCSLLVRAAALALFLCAASSSLLTAQTAPAEGPKPAPASGDPAASPADGAAAEKTAQTVVNPPPVNPASEGYRFGIYDVHSEFEVGYRWSSGIGGNDQMYRSQVNLFEGTRLLRSFVSMRSNYGSGGLFDRLDLSLNNWGDPYNTLRLNLGRMDLYQFSASYRNLNYYNFISTFANPLLEQGNDFAQHNLNVNYRMTNIELRLFPNSRISPFVGYSRNSGSGPGYTTYYPTGNEFLLQTRWQYAGDEYRGGVQFSYPRWNLTLEQGYRYLKNDTGLLDAGFPDGNDPRPFLGQDVVLDSLSRSYHGRVKLPTSKIVAKVNPLDNLRMTGRYIYTMGDLESDLFEFRSGNLVSLEDLLRYGSALDTFTGKAKRPNHNGTFLIEYSPISRLTVTDRVETFDYNVTGSALLSSLFADASSLLGPSPTFQTTVESSLSDRLEYNRVRNEAEFEYDVGYGFVARAGHRYTYTDVTLHHADGDRQEEGLSRNTALVGFYYRPGQWLRVGFSYENNRTDKPLVRTTLLNYDEFNIDWKTGRWKGFAVNGRVSILRNSDPAADIDWNSHNRNYMIALDYQLNERFSVDVDYSRTNYFSDIAIVIPQNLRSARSIFNEKTSGVGGRLDVDVYRGNRLEIGYRGIINRGSFPLDYHQPYASLWIPLGHNFAFRPFWQYYGYSETLFSLEDYRTHLVTFSLVFSK